MKILNLLLQSTLQKLNRFEQDQEEHVQQRRRINAHETQKNNLGKSSTKNPAIYIIIQVEISQDYTNLQLTIYPALSTIPQYCSYTEQTQHIPSFSPSSLLFPCVVSPGSSSCHLCEFTSHTTHQTQKQLRNLEGDNSFCMDEFPL